MSQTEENLNAIEGDRINLNNIGKGINKHLKTIKYISYKENVLIKNSFLYCEYFALEITLYIYNCYIND